MHLHEEYLSRHKLPLLPVRYKRKASAFLRSTSNPSKMRVLSSQWQSRESHPGYYKVSYCEAVHNGWSVGKFLHYQINSAEVYWDQYESYMNVMCTKIRKNGYVALPADQQLLAAWQFFLIMHDSWFCQKNKQDFFFLAQDTLRTDLSMTTRMASVNECLLALRSFDSPVYEIWSYHVHQFIASDSEWLVKIING